MNATDVKAAARRLEQRDRLLVLIDKVSLVSELSGGHLLFRGHSSESVHAVFQECGLKTSDAVGAMVDLALGKLRKDLVDLESAISAYGVTLDD